MILHKSVKGLTNIVLNSSIPASLPSSGWDLGIVDRHFKNIDTCPLCYGASHPRRP